MDEVKTLTEEGQPEQVDRTRDETIFEGTGKLNSLDAAGLEKEFEYSVGRLVSRKGDTELRLPAGAVVRVVRADEADAATVEVDGRPASKEERDAIGTFVSFRRMTSSDDDTYGSLEPRAIGEKWRPKLDAYLAGEGLVVPHGSVSGSVQLRGVRNSPAGELKDIRIEISLSNIQVKKLPPQVELGQTSYMEVIDSVVGPDGCRVESSTKAVMRMEMTVPSMKRRVVIERTHTFEMRRDVLGR